MSGGQPPEPAQRPRVLVVDDEPQIVRALKVVLREAGFETVPAETGSEALDLAAVRPPDAAIVDLVLPDTDGIAVTRTLREWSEMPILVLSAVGEEEQKVMALEAVHRSSIGSSNTNVAPCPGRDSTCSDPALASVKPRAIARPSPEPRCSLPGVPVR